METTGEEPKEKGIITAYGTENEGEEEAGARERNGIGGDGVGGR